MFMKHTKLGCNSCVCQEDRGRKRKRKAERSHKDSSSASSVDSEGEEVVSMMFISMQIK